MDSNHQNDEKDGNERFQTFSQRFETLSTREDDTRDYSHANDKTHIYPGTSVEIGRTRSLEHANIGIFPLDDDELATSMTFMKGTRRTIPEERGSERKNEARYSQTKTAPPPSPHTLANSSVLSNASSGQSEVASFNEMTRIQATVKEASQRMDRYIEGLQQLLVARDVEVGALKNQLSQLERNYEYNLDIIRERDEALQSAGLMIEQKHRALKACEERCHRAEERVAEVDRMAKECSLNAKQRELALEGEVRESQRRCEELALKHQHQLHERDARLERERSEIRSQYEQRNLAEDEARAAIVHRLEKDIADKVNALKSREAEHEEELKAVRQRYLDAERHITELTERFRQVSSERDATRNALSQAERDALERSERDKALLLAMERRAEEAERNANQGSINAEAASRESDKKIFALNAELVEARASISSLEQKVASLHSKRESETTTYAGEIERIRVIMREQIEVAEQQRLEAVERAERAMAAEQTREIDLREIKRLFDEKITELTDVKARYAETERKLLMQIKETQIVEERLYDAQSRAVEAAEAWVKEKRFLEENSQGMERKWDRLVREQASERERFHQQLSNLQSDLQSLQREFNVSESARLVLQEQLSLIDDSSNGPRKTIDALRLKNKELNEKVLQLETANATIRKQVQMFTEEMHNDPLIKQSREQTEQIEELFKERDDIIRENKRLSAELTSKEAEIQRYQVSILTTRVEHESELRAAKAEGAAHAKELASLEGEENRTFHAALKEHELWHRKALQLEVVVQKMLKERQAMADEIERIQRKVGTLTAERNALSEANNVLRVQLEESYEEGSRAATSARAAVAAHSLRAATSPAPLREVGSNAYTLPARVSPSMTSAVDAVVLEQENKINELENKIQAMRGREVGRSHVVSRSMSSSHGTSGNKPNKSPQQGVSSSPVVRGRNGATVRHYGFQ